MGPASVLGTRSKRRRTDSQEAGKRGDGKKDGKYHCNYCEKDLSVSLRIKCAVCPDYDLCLECYSVGAHTTPHAPHHAYRIVDNLSFPVYSPDWAADEEVLLVDAVELYGLGNWARVSEHVGRPPDECSAHYYAVYVETDTFPLPKPTPEMKTLDVRGLIEQRRAHGQQRLLQGTAKAVGSAPRPRGRPPGSKASAPQPKEEDGDWEAGVELEEDQEEGTGAATKKRRAGVKQDAAGGAGGAAPGMVVPLPAGAPLAAVTDTPKTSAMARRGWPTAGGSDPFMLGSPAVHAATTGGKTTVQATPLLAGDGAALLAQTEAQQTGYHVKRNEFDPEYDPEAETLIAELDFPEDEPPEEVARKLRMIDLYNLRLDERERRKAFVLSRGLLNVKRQGSVDRRRAPAERELVGRLRVLARHLPQAEWEALAEGMAVEQRLRARLAELQRYRALGMRTFDQVDRFEAAESKKKRESLPSLQAGKSRLQRIPIDETALESELAALGMPHAAAGVHAQHSTVAEGKGAEGLLPWRRARGALLDISSLPDVAPLSRRERQLCAAERFLPAQYLAVKAEAARMQGEKGHVAREEVQGLPFLVDPERSGRLHAFFLELGWVTPPPGSQPAL